MKQELLNVKGEKAGELELPEKIFGATWNADLVHQVTVIQQGNQRQLSAKVKDRSEVRGGGKKPWRQKGTGRARHGSSRSPIWKGGGVTHGPNPEKNYSRKISSKMRKKALFVLLSEKHRGKQVFFIDSLNIEKAKTKELVGLLKGLPIEKKGTLLILPNMETNIIRAARNIPYIDTIQARELNILDLAKATYIILPKESLAVIEKTFII